MREESDSESVATTLMFQNTPCRLTQDELKALLDKSGFHGTFDLVYMPRSGTMQTNIGYCFVNFKTREVSERCRSQFDGIRLCAGGKPLKVVYSRVQGGLAAFELSRRRHKFRSRAVPLVVSDQADTSEVFESYMEVMGSESSTGSYSAELRPAELMRIQSGSWPSSHSLSSLNGLLKAWGTPTDARAKSFAPCGDFFEKSTLDWDIMSIAALLKFEVHHL